MKNILDKHVGAYQGNNIYDFDNKIMLNWYSSRIIELSKGSSSLLELGLGHGFTTSNFSKYFKRHVVLDGSRSVIGNFKKNYPECKAELIETFFENFESDEKFDIVVMGFILEHVKNPSEILTRFKKYLNPNGSLFISVPNAEALNRRLGNTAGFLSDLHELSQNDLLLGHLRFYTVTSLAGEVKNAGYNIKSIEGIYLKPFTTKQIISLNFDEKIINALCQVGISYPELSASILLHAKENS